MLSDLRFAFRQLTKTPGFTAIVVLTLALAIGACTAIYSALDSIVLHPFDDPETSRNVVLRSMKFSSRTDGGVSAPDFVDLEQQAKSFEMLAQHSGGYFNMTGSGEPVRLRWNLSTERWFDVFGIKMALGRAFRPEEFVPGNDRVVVLSHACWQRVFGGARDIIGRELIADEVPRTIVGILPESHERTGNFNDAWVPRTSSWKNSSDRTARGMFTFARLRPGVTMEQAQAELDVIAAGLAQKYPETNRDYGLTVAKQTGGVLRLSMMVRTLFGAVICLMLIACANVASLLLVRANARQREMSVRAALGASRARLIRLLLTENALMALLGGAAGVLLAQWALDYIRTTIPTGAMQLAATGVARLSALRIDGGVLIFALGLSVVTVLIFGFAPAWFSSSADLNEALKQGTRGSTEGRSRGRFRATLVVMEIALTLTLLAGSGLLMRSFIKLANFDPGFDAKGSAFVRLSLGGTKYKEPEQRHAFVTRLITRLQYTNGVEAVGTASYFPISGPWGSSAAFAIEGEPLRTLAERPVAFTNFVSPDYFRTIRIPLQRGRVFAETDDATTPRVAIINQTLARVHFDGQDPVGRRLALGAEAEAWYEIVGVVGDVAQASAEEARPPQVYLPQAQGMPAALHVVVRASGDPNRIVPLVQGHVRALDPDLPVGESSTLEGFLRTKFTPQRLMLQLLMAFALIALLIAAIGLYGVIAFSVSQRTVEIGIRMALGAHEHDVLRLILRQGAWLVGAGLVAGVGGAFIAGRALEAHLYNTSGYDLVSLGGVTLFFAAMAALACWLPARRATKVDPIVALRAE